MQLKFAESQDIANILDRHNCQKICMPFFVRLVKSSFFYLKPVQSLHDEGYTLTRKGPDKKKPKQFLWNKCRIEIQYAHTLLTKAANSVATTVALIPGGHIFVLLMEGIFVYLDCINMRSFWKLSEFEFHSKEHI